MVNSDGIVGQVIGPDHADYNVARRVFNGMIDRRPALIIRCANAADVSQAIRMARQMDLTLSVYGGGHAVTGSAICDGGVVIDLRGMRRVAVDPQSRTVRAEGGVTWGELDAATEMHGLLMTGGATRPRGLAG